MKIDRRTWSAVALPVGLCLLLVAIWELVCRISHLPPWLLPRPTAVAVALAKSSGVLSVHTAQTLKETFWGFLVALGTGVGLAVLLDAIPVLRKAVYPLLVASQTVPIISVAPLIILWLGYGLVSKVFIVALVCFFPITTNLLDGFRTSDTGRLQLLRSMGANGWQRMRWVKFPSALPYLFSGLKIAATYSVMAAVIGEWLGGEKGLGIFMTRSAKSYMIDNVFSAILVITVLSLALYGLIEAVARLTIPWNYRHEEEPAQELEGE